MRPAIRPGGRAMTAAELDAAFAAAMCSKPKPLAERELQDAVLAECKKLGLDVYHVPGTARAGIRGTARGWPDLIIAGDYGMIVRECKSTDGETRGEQDIWLWHLYRAGLDVDVWRPSDLEDGRIARELGKLAHG